VGGGVETVQRSQSLLGPGLVGVGFGGRDKLAGQVRTTQGVPGVGEGVVDAQRVVHHRCAERGQHVELDTALRPREGCR
jgi:hypothetical protein